MSKRRYEVCSRGARLTLVAEVAEGLCLSCQLKKEAEQMVQAIGPKESFEWAPDRERKI